MESGISRQAIFDSHLLSKSLDALAYVTDDRVAVLLRDMTAERQAVLDLQAIQGRFSKVLESIPLTAQAFAVVDVYDALTNDRPYHSAWPRERALRHLQTEAGAHFDPVVVQTFLSLQG
ncbi:HD domain-containing phosphohydrolase [Deinococcus sp.]|uniref:HD-GYP domain-containing protein n=1 Tax=Deinococcus sp. TaxID=47478 RepID=UPI002869C98C|nr:HD domain-containing phosphohydrolase [Deinococcus sp.]